jgi:hypothetical protein
MRRGPDPALIAGSLGVAGTLVLVTLGLWLAITGPAIAGNPIVTRVLFHLAPLTFGPVGLLIATRRRGNTVAWILVAIGFFVAVTAAAGDVVHAAVGPLAAMLAQASNIGYLMLVSLVGALVLVYPDGRLPSRRWWPVGAALVAWAGLSTLSLTIAPSIPHGGGSLPNPIAVPVVVGQVAQLWGNVALALIFPLLFGVLAAAIARWRRSTGIERQQLELFVYAACLIPLGLVLSASGLPGPWSIFVNVALLGLPVAIAVAVLRYRLYDIDVLINRTLVYGLTTGGIAAAFFGGIVLLQTLLRPFTTGSEIAVAASTLLTVALFQPLRSRVQQGVDRRFSRARYDAARTIDVFAEELRDEVDLDAVRAHLLGAVGQTMSPTHASLWLRERAR